MLYCPFSAHLILRLLEGLWNQEEGFTHTYMHTKLSPISRSSNPRDEMQTWEVMHGEVTNNLP